MVAETDQASQARLIGAAASLAEAVFLAEKQGLQLQEMPGGGRGRLSQDPDSGALCYRLVLLGE